MISEMILHILYDFTGEIGTFDVGVHIADVSYFVKEKTKLDVVAGQRSTSVYLVQKVMF